MGQLHNHYKVLGLRRSAESDEIKRAYRDLMRRVHPDRLIGMRSAVGDDPEALARLEVEIAQAEYEARIINEAYAILSDPGRRAIYDGTTPVHVVFETAPTWNVPEPLLHPRFYAVLMAMLLIVLFRGLLSSGGSAVTVDLSASVVGSVHGAPYADMDAARAFDNGEYALAVDLYTTALNTAPSVDLYHARASAYIALTTPADDNAALRDYDAVLMLEPDHLAALRARGLLFAERWHAAGDTADATQAIADLARYIDLITAPDPFVASRLTTLREAVTR